MPRTGKPKNLTILNITKLWNPKKLQLKKGDRVLVEDDFNDKRVVRESLISHSFFTYDKADAKKHIRSFIRHDSEKLAKCIAKIINK